MPGRARQVLMHPKWPSIVEVLAARIVPIQVASCELVEADKTKPSSRLTLLSTSFKPQSQGIGNPKETFQRRVAPRFFHFGRSSDCSVYRRRKQFFRRVSRRHQPSRFSMFEFYLTNHHRDLGGAVDAGRRPFKPQTVLLPEGRPWVRHRSGVS
jgi:hypothetical protein